MNLSKFESQIRSERVALNFSHTQSSTAQHSAPLPSIHSGEKQMKTATEFEPIEPTKCGEKGVCACASLGCIPTYVCR